MSFESFDQVRCFILIKTQEGEWLWLCYIPIDDEKPMDMEKFSPIIPPPKSLVSHPIRCLGFASGRGMQDGTWHTILRNLQDDLNHAAEASLLTTPMHLEGVYGILF